MNNKLLIIVSGLFAVLLTAGVCIGFVFMSGENDEIIKNDTVDVGGDVDTFVGEQIIFDNESEEKHTMNDEEVNDDSEESLEDEGVASSDFSTLSLPALTFVSQGTITNPPEFQRVSFVAVGDNIVHGSVYTDAMENGKKSGKEYDFIPMFENVSDIIKEADFAYINQESPFAGKDKTISGYPMFNSPDQVGYDLIELGFDIINLANNHMLDRYAYGYQRTIDFWKDKDGMTYIGGYENEADYNNIRIVEKNGISIALLSYTYGTNGVNLDRGSEMIVPLCDSDGTAEISRQTKIARNLADIVIVSVHWGNEDQFKPSELQKKQMKVMVDNGVDVIIGTHPHVLQPMQWKERPDGGKTLVIYSLGNFLSGMLYVRNMVGGIAGFDLVKAGDRAFVTSPYFIPTVSQYDSDFRNFKIYKFSEYSQELFNSHRTNLVSDTGHSLAYMRKIIDDAIPNEFLIEDFYRKAG